MTMDVVIVVGSEIIASEKDVEIVVTSIEFRPSIVADFMANRTIVLAHTMRSEARLEFVARVLCRGCVCVFPGL
jgi:hypothetical protein